MVRDATLPAPRHPIATLAVWALITAGLAVAGVGVGGALSPSIVIAPGTPSAQAQHLAEERFGPSQLVPILLQGPADQLRRQGRALTSKLAVRPHTRVLSPWNAPAGTEGLRPSADAAMVLVALDVPEKQAVEADQPAIDALVAGTVKSPVRASVTGQPSIDAALSSQAISTARLYGLIALGVLVLILIVGLRSVSAAAMVALLASASAMSSLGVMRLLGGVFAIDPVAVPLAAMIGLAVGGAYCLIVLMSFRSALARPAPAGLGAPAVGSPDPPADGPADAGRRLAAAGALRDAGASVLLAGAGLTVALIVATAIAPSRILVSVGIGVLASAVAATISAVIALPAALTLVGGALGAKVGVPAAVSSAWARLLRGGGALTARHSLLLGPLATAVLLLFAVPLLALKVGQPGISQLPSGDPARVSFERVSTVMGPGWPTPYNVLLASSNGPMTTAATLAQIHDLERQLAAGHAVASVSGPGALSAQTRPLGKLPGALKESGKLLTGGKTDLQRLLAGLGEAGSGAQQLQGGLESASAGATELHNGSASAKSGAGRLHSGLSTARTGSATLQGGLGTALAGARQLKDGATQALAGAVDLADGTSSVRAAVAAGLPSAKQLESLTAQTSRAIDGAQQQAQGASGDAGDALAALEAMGVGRSDPHYAEALAAVKSAVAAAGGVSSALSAAAPGAHEAASAAASLATRMSFLDAVLAKLQSGAKQLQDGLAKLRQGNVALAAGIGKLASGGGQLTAGLTQLRDGAGELEAGLGLLTGGTGELQEGLSGGVAPVGELVAGLGLLQSGVARFAGQLPSPKDLEELQRDSPDLFKSGYFVLAAVEGAPPQASNAASFTVNVQGGGNAGQIAVISKHPSEDAATLQLGRRLAAQTQRFAKANHLSSALGGPAANLADLTDAVRSSIGWVILGVAVAIALLVGLALRAPAVAVAVTLLGLLDSAATFGLMTLLFGGGSPPLGGPGHLDPIAVIGVFTIAFGTVLVFLVGPLPALRRQLAGGVAGDAAQRSVLAAGGPASLAAGIVMLAVLIPFASADLSSVRQLAVGVALAVALAVLIVRPLMIPAMLALLGARGWWPGARNYGGGGGSAPRGNGQAATMAAAGAEPTVSLVHRVLRRRGHEKEVH